MQVNDDFILAIFAIAVTLSAYLSAIRMVAIQKIDELVSDDPQETDPAVKAATKARAQKEKWKLTKKLGWLTLADAPMVLSAFFLGLYLLWDILRLNLILEKQFWQESDFSLLSVGLWLFLIAGTIMLAMHVVAWFKTYCGLVTGEEKSKREVAVLKIPEVVTPAPDAENSEGH